MYETVHLSNRYWGLKIFAVCDMFFWQLLHHSPRAELREQPSHPTEAPDQGRDDGTPKWNVYNGKPY